MVATPSGGEFNRFDRDGDYVEGNIQIIEISQPKGAFLEFLAAEFGAMAGGIRQNGNDLEFYDTTVGAWVTLSSLTGQIGDIAHFTATPGQTVFNLPFSYVVGSNTLQVFIGGLRVPGTSYATPIYAETDPTTVTFNAVAPWTPFVGGELVIFYVAGRPTVNDTYLVKGDAADANPQALDQKIVGAGAAQATTIGSPANSQRQINVPFASAAPPADGGSGATGSSSNVAREDHQHPADDWDNLTAKTQGEVPFYGAAGAPSRLAPGNSGEVLTCQGAGADPIWAPGGGAGATTFLYEEQNHPGAAGPTHLITLTTGAYVVGNNELNVIVGGVVVPRSNIQELTGTTFNIINWGPIAAGTKVVVLVPKAVAETGLTNSLYEIQIAAPGQTVFNLTTGTYNIGLNQLQVYIGTSFIQNTAFTENSPTQVTLNAPGAGGPPPLVGGEPVLFLVPQGDGNGLNHLGTTASDLTAAGAGTGTLISFGTGGGPQIPIPLATKKMIIKCFAQSTDTGPAVTSQAGVGEWTIDLTTPVWQLSGSRAGYASSNTILATNLANGQTLQRNGTIDRLDVANFVQANRAFDVDYTNLAGFNHWYSIKVDFWG